jgi:hypothetical protein
MGLCSSCQCCDSGREIRTSLWATLTVNPRRVQKFRWDSPGFRVQYCKVLTGTLVTGRGGVHIGILIVYTTEYYNSLRQAFVVSGNCYYYDGK